MRRDSWRSFGRYGRLVSRPAKRASGTVIGSPLGSFVVSANFAGASRTIRSYFG